MLSTNRFLFLLAAVLVAPGAAHAFTADVKWVAGSGCSGQSPPISLAKVPRGTTQLDLKMVDLDMPSFNHGGGVVAYTGQTSIGAGEAFGFFSSYRGPCPPPGTSHRYEWTIKALDASGKTLGTAKKVVPFSR